MGTEHMPAKSRSEPVGTLIYFNFRARGEPPRLIAAYAGLGLDQDIFTMRELALWLLVEDCLLIVPDLLDPLDASFKQWYARIADLPHLAEFFASRPQVGDGTYGMPGSILHSGAPRSAGTQGL